MKINMTQKEIGEETTFPDKEAFLRKSFGTTLELTRVDNTHLHVRRIHNNLHGDAVVYNGVIETLPDGGEIQDIPRMIKGMKNSAIEVYGADAASDFDRGLEDYLSKSPVTSYTPPYGSGWTAGACADARRKP